MEAGLVFWFIYAVAIIFTTVCMWIVYRKAGQPGWGCIVPIYNSMLLCDIGGVSRWWVLALFIPIADIVAAIVISIGVAKNFGRSVGFGIGLALLGVIFYAILAFGNSEYHAGSLFGLAERQVLPQSDSRRDCPNCGENLPQAYLVCPYCAKVMP